MDDYMTVPDGHDPLQHRAEMTGKYGVRTLDMMRTTWVCTACGAEVPPPPAMILPFSRYRSTSQAADTVSQSASAALARDAGHDPCPRCHAPSRLLMADLHFFSSAMGRDLVARFAPGAPLQLLSWTLAGGVAPAPASPQLDVSIARDALVRTIWSAREQDEGDEGCALIAQAVATIPGDPELIGLLPWLARLRNLQLGAAVAEAHAAHNPSDPVGHYWRAQMLVEAVAAGQMPPAATEQALALLRQALSLRPDYPDAQIAVANVSRIRKNDAEAEQALRALLSAHPDHPEGNYTLGLILLARAPAEALACFERGERAAPQDADYPRSRARALIAMGRHAEATAAIARARELAPGDPRVEQVASEIRSNNPTAKTMTLVIRLMVAAVLIGTVVIVAVFVMRTMATVKSATQAPAVPTVAATADPAPSSALAPSPAPVAPKKAPASPGPHPAPKAK